MSSPRKIKQQYLEQSRDLRAIADRLAMEKDPVSKAALEAVEMKLTEIGRELTALARVYPGIF